MVVKIFFLRVKISFLYKFIHIKHFDDEHYYKNKKIETKSSNSEL